MEDQSKNPTQRKWKIVMKVLQDKMRFIKTHLDKRIYRILVEFRYRRGLKHSKWENVKGYIYMYDHPVLFLHQRNSPEKTYCYDFDHIDLHSFVHSTVRVDGNGGHQVIEDVHAEVERLNFNEECKENIFIDRPEQW